MNPTTNIDRMRVSGGTSPTAINGDHVLGATVNGRPSYVLTAGTDVRWSGTYWEIRSGGTERWRSASPHGPLPSDVAAWTAQNSSTGTILVVALSRGPDSLIGDAFPAAPDEAEELIVPGGGATPSAPFEIYAPGEVVAVGNGMRVQGEFLPRVADFSGKPRWRAGTGRDVYYFGGYWVASRSGAQVWLAAPGNEASPLLVSTWTAQGSTTGLPELQIVNSELVGGGTAPTPAAPGNLI